MGVSGMAAHIAADIFAHSAYALQGVDSSYTRITHSTEYTPGHKAADYTAYFPNRFECAGELVRKVVAHYYTSATNQKTRGKTEDFISEWWDRSFKLRYIKRYVKQIDNSLYLNNNFYFDAIDTEAAL